MKMNEIKTYSAIGGNDPVLVWNKNEIKSEVENTLTMACFLNAFSLSSSSISSFAFLPSSKASSSVNLLSEISALNKACLNFRDFSSFNSNTLNIIALRANSDQSSSGISLISFSNSYGIFNLNSAISTTSTNNYSQEYKKVFRKNLSSQSDFTHNVSAVADTWHAVVFNASPGSPPTTYAACSGAAGYVVEDDFEVQQSAIPEFPTVVAAIAVCMLCAVAYVVMRRKAGKR